MSSNADADWKLFLGTREPHDGIRRLPPPPPWRPFRTLQVLQERVIPEPTALTPSVQQRGRSFQSTEAIVEVINAALYLRRPVLVTGQPGSGKSSLIDAVAYELKLGEPLRWNVTSRSTLRDALYSYDAVGRLHAAEAARGSGQASAPSDTAGFMRLGPLGTALLPTDTPRALLIDEIDKADLDLPNDLLNVLDEGEFEIPELARLADKRVTVRTHGLKSELHTVLEGKVLCKQFPLVVMTSNGEREFPPAFLRRCLRLDMPDPCTDVERLTAVVQAQLGEYVNARTEAEIAQRIQAFVARASKGERLATDQLLNAVLLVAGQKGVPETRKDALVKTVTQALG